MKLDQTRYINPSLDAISDFLAELDKPQQSFKSIQIAGTNGKGSVCSFLELLYLRYKPDFKIGKYLSPHIYSVTERFSVSGSNISQDDFDSLQAKLEAYDSFAKLTYFEQLTAIAFQYFKEQGVELAILETGLGGRWDATNIMPEENRLATALTNIGWDHMDYLGDSLEKIRAEKEAIKRDGVAHFDASNHELAHNPNSASGANFKLACEIFFSINPEINKDDYLQKKIFIDFAKRYQGRFQYFEKRNLVLDGAHNPDAARVLNQFIQSLDQWQGKPKTFIIGMLDKDHRNFIKELFANGVFNRNQDRVFVTYIPGPRALPAEDLQMALAEEFSLNADIIDISKLNDYFSGLTIVTGSLFLLEHVK